jgi:ubiquinol oxidase
MNVITKSLLFALWGTKAFGFTSPHHPKFFQRKLAPRSRPIILRSTAQPVGEKSDISEESDASKRADEAIAALKKLLARQQEELRMTESLLESLQSNDGLSHIDGTPASLAASIASGFNYGFVSRSEGANFTDIKGGVPGYGPPASIWRLGWQQCWRNWDAMKGEYADEEPVGKCIQSRILIVQLELICWSIFTYLTPVVVVVVVVVVAAGPGLTPKQEEVRALLERLTLNSTAIWEKENALGPVEGPWVIKVPYYILCWFLDVLFEGRYAPSRFFLLETVARMPYFSYITMLHLYETLGFWRRSVDMKRIHFAEEMNEFRHLMIMESLGGDQQWWVRFIAQHSAIVYYFILCLLWGLSPSLSYKFSEMLESHAVNTYGQFLEDNPEVLKKLPPPTVAVEYYALGASDPFFAEIQTSSVSKGSTVSLEQSKKLVGSTSSISCLTIFVCRQPF